MCESVCARVCGYLLPFYPYHIPRLGIEFAIHKRTVKELKDLKI